MRFLLLPVLFLGTIIASLIGFAVVSNVLIFFGFDYPFDEARACSTGIGEQGACFARVHLTHNGGPTLYLPFVRARIFKNTLRLRLWPQREREVPLAALMARRGGVVGPLDLLGLWRSCAFQWKLGNASGTIALAAHHSFVRELEEAVKRAADA